MIDRMRYDPLYDRSIFPEITKFGEYLAIDIIIIFEESSKDEYESRLFVIRDRSSDFLRSFSLIRRSRILL